MPKHCLKPRQKGCDKELTRNHNRWGLGQVWLLHVPVTTINRQLTYYGQAKGGELHGPASLWWRAISPQMPAFRHATILRGETDLLSGEDAPRKLEQSLVVGARLATIITGKYKKIGDSGRIAITVLCADDLALSTSSRGSSTAMASVAACYGRLLEDNTSSSVVRNSPLSQPTGPAISMLPCPSCRACSCLAKPAQPHHPPGSLQPQRQEGEKWNTKSPSSGVPCMFCISSVSLSPSPTCLAGEEPTLGLGKCA